MGHSMAMHLLNAGNELYIYSRTKSKAEDLIAKGAIWCENAKEVAEKVEMLFTIVGFVKDVESVYLGKDSILEGAHSGLLCCDMSTTSPSLMLTIGEKLKAKGTAFMDAPVSGGDVGARNATLSIMVGSSDEDFERALPFLSIMGKSINLQGPLSSGQQTKMCNQITIAGTMIGMCEALVYASKANLDLTAMVNTISKGAAGCWSLDNLAPRVIKGDFNPGFMISHFVKDMSIALDECEKMDIFLPGLTLVKGIYKGLIDYGYEENGTQALVKAISGNY